MYGSIVYKVAFGVPVCMYVCMDQMICSIKHFRCEMDGSSKKPPGSHLLYTDTPGERSDILYVFRRIRFKDIYRYDDFRVPA